MRKGFILTLTALSTAFLVTSAVALGPTVKPVPDVFIGPEGVPAETYTNMFRYSNALLLWDYVEPGVLTGDGSTSDTLYWAWAAKDATPSGPTGTFLDPSTSDIHYSIIQESSVEGLAILPAGEVGDAGWVADINGILAAQGGALSDYSVANAGQLTFRNIRLSPPPDMSYGAPTAIPGLPAGYLDMQEATLYVSDGSTTPGTDTTNLVTLDAGQDYLSGGPVFEMVADHSSDTGPFNGEKLAASNDTGQAGIDLNPSAVTLSKTASSLSITCALTNTNPGWYIYGKYTYAQPVQPGFIYRVQADVSIAATGTAPSAVLAMNARAGSGSNAAAGYGFSQILAGQLGATPVTKSGYLVPAQAGNPAVEVFLLDVSDAQGGTLTATNVQVQRVDLQQVLDSASAVLTVTDFTIGTGNWTSFTAPFGTSPVTLPTFNLTSTSGPDLSITATTSASDVFNIGLASFEGPTATVTAGKLIVARYGVRTSSADTAKLPTLYLVVQDPTSQGGFALDRDTATGSGPSSTPKDYYVVYETTGTTAKATFSCLAASLGINGNLTLGDLTVYSADIPSGP